MGDFEVWPIGVPGSSDWMQRETPLMCCNGCTWIGGKDGGCRSIEVGRLRSMAAFEETSGEVRRREADRWSWLRGRRGQMSSWCMKYCKNIKNNIFCNVGS